MKRATRRKLSPDQARWLIASGIYDDPLILDDIVEKVLAQGDTASLLSSLKKCPVGEGNHYRDLTACTFVRAFGADVDVSMMRSEFGVAGGRSDLEIPFRIEALVTNPLLADWRQRFAMTSILVEVKNERDLGTVDHVRQIESDVRSAPLGNVGFLVCRSGLTSAAKHKLREINKSRQVLVLPFRHQELKLLAQMPKADVAHYLHQKELHQLQMACD